MPSAAWAAVMTISIFLITHIGMTIWWMSRVTTLLDIVQMTLKDVVQELKLFRAVYVTKEEFSYFKAEVDKQHEAMWRRVDEERRERTNGGRAPG